MLTRRVSEFYAVTCGHRARMIITPFWLQPCAALGLIGLGLCGPRTARAEEVVGPWTIERGVAVHAEANRGKTGYLVVARSPKSDKTFLGSPAMVILPSGRYVASYDLFDNDPRGCVVVTSDDRGITWTKRATIDLMWASSFVQDGSVYLLGSHLPDRAIAIARSTDGGDTWSDVVALFDGQYTGGCVSILKHQGRVYRAFERQAPPRDEWTNDWRSVAVAGDLAHDLLDPQSWRISNEVSYPGTPDTLTQGLFVSDRRIKKPREGWLEGNVVERNGRLLILLRTRMQAQATANLTSVCELTDDGKTLKNRFLQFYPMPGGQNKFHVIQDPRTGIYWTSTNQVTDSFQDIEPLLQMGFKGTGGNERRIQVLMYSKDALHWFQAGLVAYSPNLMEAFSYAWLVIEENDLLVLCRTSQGGRNNHDTNLITLHRIKNFRSMVPKGLLGAQAP